MTGEHTVKTCRVTGKAVAAYSAFHPGTKAGHIAEMMKGKVVRRMSDDSPYFILTENWLRFVFCLDRKRRRSLESGCFMLVNVQLDRGWRDDKEDLPK